MAIDGQVLLQHLTAVLARVQLPAKVSEAPGKSIFVTDLPSGQEGEGAARYAWSRVDERQLRFMHVLDIFLCQWHPFQAPPQPGF
jgi:hypothetical protein